jgi:hypothetical protein
MTITDAMIGRVALAAEYLLTDANADQLAAELRAHVPAGLLDQHQAAARDVRAGVTRALADDDRLVLDEGRTLPGGLVLGMCATLVGWRAGRGETCDHCADPRVAQPVIIAAWRPDRVVCAECIHLLSLPRGSDRDKTCDECGWVCAGPERGDGVWPGMAVAGSVSLLYGLCGGCHDSAGGRT